MQPNIDYDYLSTLSDDEAREVLLALEKNTLDAARESLITYIQWMDPGFVVSRHHEVICEKLEAVERGEIKRLMVFMPPRSGKSRIISQEFPSWFLGRNPRKQVLAVSYSMDLTEEWGRTVKNRIMDKNYQAVFPGVKLTSDSRAAIRWDLEYEGITGTSKYRAGSITGGIAGKGAHLGLIDDPLNEQSAYSQADKNHVWRWYPGGFRSRVMPNGSIILLMTRWALDDLAGHLIDAMNEGEGDDWEVLSIPALLDEDGSKLLNMPQGTSYWPVVENAPEFCELAGWPTEELLATKKALPPDQWNCLYQQNPIADEGNILKFEQWQDWVKDNPPTLMYSFLSIDTAFSTKETADFSAITRWGIFKDDMSKWNMILLGAHKGRWDFPTLRTKIIAQADVHEPDAILIEKKASGQSIAQELVRAGYPVREYQPDRDKIARAYACSNMFHEGRIWAPRDRDWANDVIVECAQFPKATHDDYVDTVTQAVIWARSALMIIANDEPWHDDEDKPKKKLKSYWTNVTKP